MKTSFDERIKTLKLIRNAVNSYRQQCGIAAQQPILMFYKTNVDKNVEVFTEYDSIICRVNSLFLCRRIDRSQHVPVAEAFSITDSLQVYFLDPNKSEKGRYLSRLYTILYGGERHIKFYSARFDEWQPTESEDYEETQQFYWMSLITTQAENQRTQRLIDRTINLFIKLQD